MAREPLDRGTRTIVQRLHRAWSNGATVSTYAKIRDEILAGREQADICIATLNTVAEIAFPRQLTADSDWAEFRVLANFVESDGDVNFRSSQPKRASNERNRRRNLAIVAALWSPQVVAHYGWNTASQGRMNQLKLCATRYPRFDSEFRPRLNFVLLERHCAGIQNGRVKTLNEAPLQSYRDLALVLSEPTALDEATENEWIVSNDGVVPVDENGSLLCHARPGHFRMYLLQKDRYGVLEARKDNIASRTSQSESFTGSQHNSRLATPASRAESTSDSTVPGGSERASISPQPMDRTPIEPSSPTRKEDSVEQESQSQFDLSPSSFPPPHRTPASLSTTQTPRKLSNDSPSPLPAYWNQASLPLDPLNASPKVLPDMTFPHTEDIFSTVSPLSLNPELNSTWVNLATASQLDASLSAEKGSSTEDLEDESWLSTTQKAQLNVADNNEGAEGRPITHTRATDQASISNEGEAMTSTSLFGTSGGCQPDLRIDSPQVADAESMSLDEVLYNHHHNAIAAVASTCVFEANISYGIIDERRSDWLKLSTQWVHMHTARQSKLPQGRALALDEADVEYATADGFMDVALKDCPLRKPVVIKEKFTDSGMHTVDTFLSHLHDLSAKEPLQYVQSDHGREDTAIEKLGPFGGEGGNIPATRWITKAHRPLWTMLPRFRLLDTLMERARRSNADDVQIHHRSETEGYLNFNILSAEGFLSKPQMNAVCGTWLRVLDGVVFWLIVPEGDMDSEWDNFVALKDEWVPPRAPRFLVLERDDVLLLPAGVKVAYALYSPSKSLIEGGRFCDDQSILSTLHIADWLRSCNSKCDEPIINQLGRILREVQSIAREQPNRFENSLSNETFLSLLHKIDASA